MKRLTDAVELLDGPLDDPDALAGNLRDLRRINRHLGGIELSATAIEALAAHRGELTMLDVGTGGGDIPLGLLQAADRRGRHLAVMGIDSRPEVVAAARLAAQAASVDPERLEIQVADGRAIPFSDRSYDVAHASLVLHHLSPDDAVALLSEMGRVARLGVVVNDLDRGRVAWLRRLALRPPADRQPVHPSRCSAFGPTRLSRRRGGGSSPGRRPRPRGDGLGRLRPAVRHRRRAGMGRRQRAGAGRWTGRRRVTTDRVEVAIVGGGPAGAVLATWLAQAGHEVSDPRALGHLALAGIGRLHLAGRRGGTAPIWPRRGHAGRRRPSDPGDARRDARRDRPSG